jgi:hypothetical protein
MLAFIAETSFLWGGDVVRQPISLDSLRGVFLVVVAGLLCSCAGVQGLQVQLHDESRAKLAASGKKDYTDAKVIEVIEADRKNAEFLLAAEITAVRENFALQVDYAALEIANNTTPMRETYKEARQRLDRLGFANISQLRADFKDDAVLRSKKRTLASYEKVIASMHVVPDCKKELKDLSLTDTQKSQLEKIYGKYLAICAEIKSLTTQPEGLIAIANAEWQAAKKDLDAATEKRRQAEKTVADAKAAYEKRVKAIKAAKERGQEIAAELTSTAQELANAVKAAKDLDPGVADKEQIDALVEILTAIAGGDINPQDPNVARAAAVAKEMPLLVADIAQMEATRTAPPVSGLLLALRHKTLLADAARTRAQLEQERVGILKVKYEAYLSEANHLRRFHDAMCSYAALSGGQAHPGDACNNFTVDDAGTCSIVGRPALTKCALGQQWKEAFRAVAKPDTKRELYKSVTNYLQALSLQAVPVEETFREIDVRQRETLLAKRSALETWDNLVSLPIEQLDGYYQGGVKPAEIADLILKALTFTAIAIGVSK